jgi:uncharacterized membrane protein YcjF (UPF0283 family)
VEFLLASIILPFLLSVEILVHGKRWIVDGYRHEAWFLYTDSFWVSSTLSTLFICAFVSLLKFVEDWFELEAKKKEIENEGLMAEFDF